MGEWRAFGVLAYERPWVCGVGNRLRHHSPIDGHYQPALLATLGQGRTGVARIGLEHIGMDHLDPGDGQEQGEEAGEQTRSTAGGLARSLGLLVADPEQERDQDHVSDQGGAAV